MEAISELRSHGVKIEILSGDAQASVEAFAREIGIDPSLCRGGVDPEGYAEYVTKRSAEDRTLIACDGFHAAGAAAQRCGVEMIRRGVFVRPGGKLYLSTAHTAADIDRTLEVAAAVLSII